MKPRKRAEFDLTTFELSCIILVMQKVNSEKWHNGRNGLYLDFHEQRILKKLVKIQEDMKLQNAMKIFKVIK